MKARAHEVLVDVDAPDPAPLAERHARRQERCAAGQGKRRQQFPSIEIRWFHVAPPLEEPVGSSRPRPFVSRAHGRFKVYVRSGAEAAMIRTAET